MKTNISHPQIVKRFDIKIVIISAIIAALGLISLFLSYITVGAILLIVSLVLYFVKSTTNIYSPSGSYIKTECCYFDKDQLGTIKGIIEKGITDETPLFKLSQNGSGRLDMVFSADKEFAAVQLYRFVPHTYEPATEMMSFTGLEAARLLKYIGKCRV